jgi:hypothetical protein
MVVDFFCGRGLAFLALAAAWLGRRDRWLLFALSCLAALLATAAILPTAPHYMAPVLGVVWLLVVRAFRVMAHHKVARWGLVPILVFYGLLLPAWRLTTPEAPSFDHSLERRADVLARLEGEPGKHVVLVRYEPDHVVHMDWVFNLSDLDGAKVVWARDDVRYNGELVDYYRERRFWCVDGDTTPPDLRECTPQIAAESGPISHERARR